MRLHEYQAKTLLRQYEIPVPESQLAVTVEEAVAVAKSIGGGKWLVKAQVHVDNRGKVGGVRWAGNLDELKEHAQALLGEKLALPRSSVLNPRPVTSLLIEKPVAVAQELYLGLLIDRVTERIVVIMSASGGVDIEVQARKTPEKVFKVAADLVLGLQPSHCRDLGYRLGFSQMQISELTKILLRLYRLFTEKDLLLLELNPFCVTTEGDLVAVGAKLKLDDNARYRQRWAEQWRDLEQEDDRELRAHSLGLSYVSLKGSIGCLVNGAGLAMATMDLVKLENGEPANFLDVGWNADADVVNQAFELIVSDPQVKAVWINIFGGIVRCDAVAEGIVMAANRVGCDIPLVVRLEGTNAALGQQILLQSGLKVILADGLADAAQKVVKAART